MNWKVILPWVFAIIAAIILVVTLFKPSQKQDTKYFDLLLAEKDKSIQREQSYRIEVQTMYDKIIEESRYKDSLLQLRSKTNTIRYERIPVVVNSLSQPELVSTIETEFGQ